MVTQKNTIEQPIEKTDNTAEPIIVVNDQNDPVIIENKEKIENELRVYQAPDQKKSKVRAAISVNDFNGGCLTHTGQGEPKLSRNAYLERN